MRKIAAASLFLAGLTLNSFAQTSLEQGFRTPPNSAKAYTWWHWINGNISKPGITKDLEAMKRFGLGGAQIFNVDVSIPAGDAPFMGAKWKNCLAWAFSEAKRLGLELDIHNGAGWSSSGGPWVKPEDSMQFLTWSETKVHGPQHFEGVLPEPAKKLNYYRDVVAYAFKQPANEKFRIANIRAKAGFDRGDRISPDPTGIPADAAISASEIRQISLGAGGRVSVDLPAGDWVLVRMGSTPTGAENEPAPKPGLGPEVDKLSREALDHFWSGMMATAVQANGAVGKAGLVGALIDSYEVGSQNWTPKFRQEFMKRRGYDPMPYLLTVTGRVVNSGGESERFLWDFRKTICDLFADNYYGYMAELCHKNGLRFCTEGYGNGSFDNLEVSGTPDVPMAEFWIGGLATETTKMVSSSAHTHGKPVIGAEAFTADTPHARWMYDPYAIKSLGDQIFSLGVNRYIFHRYAHQPWTDLEPGMTMGPWGTNFDRTITWWDQGRAWMQYVARCQYLLQSGRFIADVLVFEGDDAPNDLPMMGGKEIPVGYDYDGCDAKTLWSARVEKGEIVLPSGMRYRVLLLPQSRLMTVRTARKIAELASGGATLLGPVPNGSPSLAERGAGDSEVAAIGRSLQGSMRYFSNTSVNKAVQALSVKPDLQATRPVNWIHRQIDGADVYFVANPAYKPIDLDATFRVTGKQPEIWNPEDGSSMPSLIWRAEGGRTTVPLHLESAGSLFVVFRGSAPAAHLTSATWLGTGQGEPKPPVVQIISARYEAADGTGGVDVTAKVRGMLAQGETSVAANNSNFGDPTYNHVKRLHIVYTLNGKQFEKNVAENDELAFVPAGPDNALPSFTLAGDKLLFWKAGAVDVSRANGSTQHLSGKPSSVEVKIPWTLRFPDGKGAPTSVPMPELVSWTEVAQDGVKHFSGTATYVGRMDVSRLDRTGAEYWLDLGRVKNFAEVSINGHPLPTLWKAPFRQDVTQWLRKGSNDLQVKVTNLWPNRLIGDEQYPADASYRGPIQAWPNWLKDPNVKRPPGKRTTFTTWQFFTKDSPLLESGLLGPVRLMRVPTLQVRPGSK